MRPPRRAQDVAPPVTSRSGHPRSRRCPLPAAPTLDRSRLARLMDRELATFAADNPRSMALHERAQGLAPRRRPDELDGQVGRRRSRSSSTRRPAPGSGRRRTRVRRLLPRRHRGDGRPRPGARRSPPSSASSRRGITHMLPTEDAIAAGDELRRRFGLPLLAVHAHRHRRQPVRDPARPPHHRPVEDRRPRPQLPRLGRRDVRLARRPTAASSRPTGNIGPPVDPALTTRVVQFNDVAALERALADGDVAAVLVEPALTNVGIVLPEPGYHDARPRADPRAPARS